jgi:hypothetical protein
VIVAFTVDADRANQHDVLGHVQAVVRSVVGRCDPICG